MESKMWLLKRKPCTSNIHLWSSRHRFYQAENQPQRILMMHHHASSLVKYVLPVAIDISKFKTQKGQTFRTDSDQSALKKTVWSGSTLFAVSVILFENTYEKFWKLRTFSWLDLRICPLQFVVFIGRIGSLVMQNIIHLLLLLLL